MTSWNPGFIQRYGMRGPRYTSYPSSASYHEEITTDDFWRALAQGNDEHRPVSLYMHIPFCEHICFFCACNRIVTADRGRASDYLQFLLDELTLKARHIDGQRPVSQLHWGGGTPTFLSDAEITGLVYHTARNFHLLDNDRGDYSVEIDPRTVTEKRIALLRGLGFNRASVGVQDLDPHVQKAVNRVQPFEQVRDVLGWLRDHGFRSINIDLIYGLPWQSESSMVRTLGQVLALRPERIALFNYQHMPERFKAQRHINELALPAADEKVRMLVRAGEMIEQAGYRWIGIDQFALPEDSLAQAQEAGTLQRNIQGYTLHGDADVIGFGTSAISEIGPLYAQNHTSVNQWQSAIADADVPLERGVELDFDDRVRRDLIRSLVCLHRVDLRALGERWQIDATTYFSAELAALAPLADIGMLDMTKTGIILTDKARLVSRAVAMQFDRYLGGADRRQRLARIL